MKTFLVHRVLHPAWAAARSAPARTLYTAVVLLAIASASITTLAKGFVGIDTVDAMATCSTPPHARSPA